VSVHFSLAETAWPATEGGQQKTKGTHLISQMGRRAIDGATTLAFDVDEKENLGVNEVNTTTEGVQVNCPAGPYQYGPEKEKRTGLDNQEDGSAEFSITLCSAIS
jgi:hypothetical protein